MTAFTKENLQKRGDSLYYVPANAKTWADFKFVARFKYASKSSIGPWATFMRKNFTVEEYFAQMDKGISPLAIVESKGFILTHIKKWLKDAGYPVTKEGFQAYLEDSRKKYMV